MKKQIIYLARHGETEFNRTGKLQGRGINAPLNERGRAQAAALGDYFESVPLQHVYVSSLIRTHQTAEEVAQPKSLKIKPYSDLDEMDFGVLEGRSVHEVKEELKRLHQRWREGDIDYAADGGESPRAVFDRADGCIAKLISNQTEPVLFVLHGRLIRILLSKWLHGQLSQMHKIPHANAAIYKLDYRNGSYHPHVLNDTAHLQHLSNSIPT